MSITSEEISHLARLGRLRLEPDEERILAEQLGGILEHMDALSGIPEDEGDGSASAEGGRTPLRDDGAVPDTMIREPDVAAPAWESSFYLVPRLRSRDPLPDPAG